MFGGSFTLNIDSASTQNWTGTLAALAATASADAGATGTISLMRGGLIAASNSGGTWKEYRGLEVSAPTGGGTISTKSSFYAATGAGKAVLTDGAQIGFSGATMLAHLSNTASLDFTALAANTCEVLTITLTGAADGDTVTLGVPNALADVDGGTGRTTFLGWVSAANTVSVRRCNVTGTVTADPLAATVRADVWQH
jgi:hypothetical protein